MNELTSFRAALMYRLVAGLGLASAVATAGCGDSQQGSGSSGGGGSGAGGAGGATTTSTDTTGSTTTDTDTDTTGSAGGGGSTSTTGSAGGGGSTSTTDTGQQNVERCFFNSNPPCPEADVAVTVYGSCTADAELVTMWLSGPIEVGTDCCYQVDVSAPGNGECGIVGRPFVVEGRARFAPVGVGVRGWNVQARRTLERSSDTARAASAALRPDVTDLDEATRTWIGRDWAQDAAFEHASVASFGKLALELLAFGAPAELVRAAHDAALDEIRHAQMGFELASGYLGAPVGPGKLAEARSFAGATTLVELAAAAVREGCVGETLAAVVASAQRQAATDRAVREVLAIVAEDESRHAELAFRVVAWAIAVGGEEVRTAAHRAFLEAVDETTRAGDGVRGAPALASVRAHGRLSAAELATERRRAVEEVVAPAMALLLGAQA